MTASVALSATVDRSAGSLDRSADPLHRSPDPTERSAENLEVNARGMDAPGRGDRSVGRRSRESMPECWRPPLGRGRTLAQSRLGVGRVHAGRVGIQERVRVASRRGGRQQHPEPGSLAGFGP
jgi:hypothetical protein